MAMLNFKMGSWTKEFDKLAKVPGTVYVTTNEKAMYVDVDANTRIRIGDIIQVNSAKAAEPPFSTEALYYFIEENALMKWNGSEWKQLNKVSDIQASISDLQDSIATLKANVGTAATTDINGQPVAATGLYKDIVDLQAKDADLQSQITANKEAIESNDQDIENLTTRMSAAEAITGTVSSIADQVATNKTNIETVTATIGNADTAGSLVYRTNAIEASIGNEETEDSILYRIKNVETLATDNKTAIGSETTTGTIKNRIKVLEDGLATTNTTVGEHTATLSDHTDAINELKTAVGDGADGLASKVETLTTELNTAKSDITSIQAKNEEQDTKIKDAADQAATNKTAIEELTGDETKEGSVKHAVKAEADLRAAADTALQNNIDNLASRVGAVETKNTEQDTAIKNAANQAAENKTAIDKLNDGEDVEGSVAYKVKEAKDALSAEIDKDINAANAMEYQGSISKIADLPSSDVKIGDTYVVASKFSDNGITYNAGDMLIAKGTEDEATGIIGNDLSWNHVKTGYDVANEAHLVGSNNAINLTSHLSDDDGDLGKITFADGGSGIKTAIADNTITLTIEWGTF